MLEREEQSNRRRQMGLRRVEDINCAVSACVAVCACANDLCACERVSERRRSQRQRRYSMHDTDSRIYAGHKTKDGDKGSLCWPPDPLCDSLSLSAPPPPTLHSVYLCFALSFFDNDPVMGLSKSKVAIFYGLSVSIDCWIGEKRVGSACFIASRAAMVPSLFSYGLHEINFLRSFSFIIYAVTKEICVFDIFYSVTSGQSLFFSGQYFEGVM